MLDDTSEKWRSFVDTPWGLKRRDRFQCVCLWVCRSSSKFVGFRIKLRHSCLVERKMEVGWRRLRQLLVRKQRIRELERESFKKTDAWRLTDRHYNKGEGSVFPRLFSSLDSSVDLNYACLYSFASHKYSSRTKISSWWMLVGLFRTSTC